MDLEARRELDGVSLHLINHSSMIADFKRWLGERHAGGDVALDLETSGLSPYDKGARIRLAQIGDAMTGWAIPWDMWPGLVIEALSEYDGPLILHNGAFDIKWMETHSPWRADWLKIRDTMIAARLVNPLFPAGLKPQSDRFIDRRASHGQKLLDEAFVKHGWTWDTVPIDFEPYWCVPTDTEILTRSGWKKHSEVQTGDETLGYDNGDLVWTTVEQVQTFEDAPLVRVGNSRWSTECTPNHRWLYQSPKYLRGRFEGYGDVKIAPLNEIQQRSSNRLVLTGYGPSGTSDITPDEARMVAWLVTDGHIQWQRPRSSPIARIFQSEHKYHSEVRELLTRVGAYVSERSIGTNAATGNTNIRFYVQATYVTTLWNKAGLHDRSLSQFVMELSREARAAWLGTVVLADGVTRGPKARLPRTEVAKAFGEKHDAIVLAAYLEGHLPTVRMHGEGSAIVGFGSEKRLTFQKSKPVSTGSGQVWCPVTGAGTWTARDRDGHVFVTGNTYAALDTVLTVRLDEMYQPAVGPGSPYAEAYDLEMATLRITTRMEQKGALIDLDYCTDMYDKCADYEDSIKKWARASYGIEIGSPSKLARKFHDLGADITVFTEKGHPKVDKWQLQIFADPDNGYPMTAQKLAEQVLLQRKYGKLASSYFGNFIAQNTDGVIHASINPMAARTGRMSISNPALQQLPRGDAMVRTAFIPREGNVLIATDFSQIEMRMLGHFSADPELQKAFHDADDTGGDFFVNIGREVYREPGFDKKDKRRNLIKSSMYGLAYGAGVAKMAETAGIPEHRMKDVVEALTARYPGIKNFMRQVEDIGKRREYAEGEGYVLGIDGRRLPCDTGRVYALVNYLIQGSAAIAYKKALSRLDAAGYGDTFIIPVHDEIVMDIPAEDADDALADVPRIMKDTSFAVDIPADAEGPFAHSWGEKYAK